MYANLYKYIEISSVNPWTKAYLKPDNEYFSGIEISKILYLCGTNGSIIYSNNGYKWNEIETNITEDLIDIAVLETTYEYLDEEDYTTKITDKIVITVSKTNAYISYDLKKWIKLEGFSTSFNINGVYCDSQSFYIYGNLLYTSEFGEDWSLLESNIGNIKKIKEYNDNIVAIQDDGLLFYINKSSLFRGSSLSPALWFNVSNLNGYVINDIIEFKNVFYVCGENGFVAKSDGLEFNYEWDIIPVNPNTSDISNENFLCLNNSYNIKVATESGRIFSVTSNITEATYRIDGTTNNTIHNIYYIDYNKEDIEELTSLEKNSIIFTAIGKDITVMDYIVSSVNVPQLVLEHKGTCIDMLIKEISLCNMFNNSSTNSLWIENEDSGETIHLIPENTIINPNDNLFVINKTLPLKVGDKLYYKSNYRNNTISVVYTLGE